MVLAHVVVVSANAVTDFCFLSDRLVWQSTSVAKFGGSSRLCLVLNGYCNRACNFPLLEGGLQHLEYLPITRFVHTPAAGVASRGSRIVLKIKQISMTLKLCRSLCRGCTAKGGAVRDLLHSRLWFFSRQTQISQLPLTQTHKPMQMHSLEPTTLPSPTVTQTRLSSCCPIACCRACLVVLDKVDTLLNGGQQLGLHGGHDLLLIVTHAANRVDELNTCR